MEQVKLLSMTVIVTVLVWASADSLVSETTTVNVSFDATPSMRDSDMLVEAVGSVEVRLSGPRKTIEDAQAREWRRVRLPIPERPTGETAVLLDKNLLKRQMTERWAEFQRLAVVAVQPETIPIRVDHMITTEVDISLGRLSLQYDDEPQLSRTRVSVRMRESLFRELAPNGRLSPVDITGEVERQLREKPAGQSATVSVTFDAALFGSDAVMTPPGIEVTATVSAERSTEEIPTVPILLAVSFANLQKGFSAVPRDGIVPVTRTIEVIGPTVEVQRLLSGRTRAFGLIQLKEDDLHVWDDYRPRKPEYHLPPGIELAEEPEPIEFKLIEHTDTEIGS